MPARWTSALLTLGHQNAKIRKTDEEVPMLIGKLPGRAMLSAGGKPYIAVRMNKGDKVLDTLKTLFG